MKIRPFLLFILSLLLLSAPLGAAQAPKLETLLAEYKKARSDVLGKLNEAYAAQADVLAGQYQAVANLDGADRAREFAKRLRNPDESNAAIGISASDKPGDQLATLQTEYSRARADNLNNVYTFYATTAANLRQELLKTKDQAGAQTMAAFLEKIKPTAAKATPAAAPSKSHNTSSR